MPCCLWFSLETPSEVKSGPWRTFSCIPLLLHQRPVDVLLRCGEREVFSKPMIKLQSFDCSMPLFCDLHKCFLAFLSLLSWNKKVRGDWRWGVSFPHIGWSSCEVISFSGPLLSRACWAYFKMITFSHEYIAKGYCFPFPGQTKEDFSLIFVGTTWVCFWR